jgi:hypothetical protein
VFAMLGYRDADPSAGGGIPLGFLLEADEAAEAATDAGAEEDQLMED